MCICQFQSPSLSASFQNMGFPGDSEVRNPPAMQETWVWSLVGHDHPLQHACLENPMDGGTWWVTVYRAAKSQTQLKWLNRHAGRHISRHTCFSPEVTINLFFTSVTKHLSVYGKMLETGLIEIIPWICPLATQGQYPVLSHPGSPWGTLLGVATVAEVLAAGSLFVSILSSLRAHHWGATVAAWWLQHPLFTDIIIVGRIFLSQFLTYTMSRCCLIVCSYMQPIPVFLPGKFHGQRSLAG